MSPYEWNWAPGVLIALAAYLVVYVIRWRAVRAEDGPRGASRWRLLAFLCGLLALFVALISPVDALGERLFVMHMAQHILLTDVAAILLILGLTRVVLRPVTARVQRLERAAGPFAHPVFAVILYVSTLWFWHIPAMYDAALESPVVHALEHMTFTGAALLFWWHLLSPIRSRQRLPGIGIVFYLAVAKLGTGLLASFIAFSPEPRFEHYARQVPMWGLDASSDQGVAGAIMVLQDSLFVTTALAYLVVRMLSESEQEEQRAERYGTRP